MQSLVLLIQPYSEGAGVCSTAHNSNKTHLEILLQKRELGKAQGKLAVLEVKLKHHYY